MSCRVVSTVHLQITSSQCPPRLAIPRGQAAHVGCFLLDKVPNDGGFQPMLFEHAGRVS
jgi:hypothetical protein